VPGGAGLGFEPPGACQGWGKTAARAEPPEGLEAHAAHTGQGTQDFVVESQVAAPSQSPSSTQTFSAPISTVMS